MLLSLRFPLVAFAAVTCVVLTYAYPDARLRGTKAIVERTGSGDSAHG